ncbi:hypothetical protein A5662_02675 [Mycobacteriaceae bacterium 1482268.1]|nr:hypothetical protein A5662_02675 [Mycobacteriaceae bacterium 1482268.1]
MTQPTNTGASDIDTDGRLECDVVMKGGITSGIIYPRLIVELSKKYRFRRVGGASAGAIAATMTAAAQAGQWKEDSKHAGEAFGLLTAIPDTLARNMSHLFQPSPGTSTAYDILMAFLRPGRPKLIKLAVAAGLIIYRGAGWFLLATAMSMIPALCFVVALLGAPGNTAEWLALGRALVVWLPIAAAIGIVVAAVQLGRSALKEIIANGFGICDGHTRRPNAPIEPLTDWMHDKLKELAGPIDGDRDRPVCFGDLWGRTASETYRGALKIGKGELAELTPTRRRELRELRDVDCLVITTDLNHQRPYEFPFNTAEFFWCRRCFGKYFPDSVVKHMEKNSGPVSSSVVIDPTCPLHTGEQLRYMPLAPDVPLVLAARLSLSFPGLISAVPLYAVDRTRVKDQQRVVTVWFSDGGISSNFPMRFFDAAWPQRPTFGINLATPHPDYPEMVWRSPPGQSGRFLRYAPITSLGGFVGAIFNSARNWADSTQIAMPGFRDRVVEIRQRPDEGGMNLQMPPEVIARLADRGAEAGRNILYGDGKKTLPFNFDAHRWMRYRNAMASLDELLTGMHGVWTAENESQQAFLRSNPPPPGFPQYRPGENDYAATEAVMSVAAKLAELGHPAVGVDNVPHPEPDMRLTPPL